MLQDRRTATVLILALSLIYIAARVWRLSDSCLWFDEIFSVHAAEHDWNALLWFVAQDLIHPPLFYVLLKLWIGIAGESVFWLRMLPVLFSALSLIPLIYLSRELKLPNSVSVLALAMLTVNGSLIKYTQTLRMYSMLIFLASLSTWLFARYFYRGKSFVPLVIVNLLLIYTHYFGWLVIGAEMLAILIFQRIKWRRVVVMTGILFVSFIPWVLSVWNAARAGSDVGQNIGWMSRPGIREMTTFLFDLTEPFYYQASNAEAASMYRITIPILLVLVMAAVFYFIGRDPTAERQPVYLLATFVLFPTVLAFIASWLLPHSVWGTRHLIVIYAPIALLFAYFLTRIPIGWVRTASIALLFLFYGYGFYVQAARPAPRYVWCEWENVAADIRSRDADKRISIYAFEELSAYHLWFALRDSPQHRVAVVKGLNVKTDDAMYFLPRGFDAVPKVSLEGFSEEQVWLAFRTSKDGEDAPLIEAVRQLGYEPCPRESVQYGSTTVFWLRMTRSGDGCLE